MGILRHFLLAILCTLSLMTSSAFAIDQLLGKSDAATEKEIAERDRNRVQDNRKALETQCDAQRKEIKDAMNALGETCANAKLGDKAECGQNAMLCAEASADDSEISNPTVPLPAGFDLLFQSFDTQKCPILNGEDYTKNTRDLKDEIKDIKDDIKEEKKDLATAEEDARKDFADVQKELADLKKDFKEQELSLKGEKRTKALENQKALQDATDQMRQVANQRIAINRQKLGILNEKNTVLGGLTDFMIQKNCSTSAVQVVDDKGKPTGQGKYSVTVKSSSQGLIQAQGYQNKSKQEDYRICVKQALEQRRLAMSDINAKIEEQDNNMRSLNAKEIDLQNTLRSLQQNIQAEAQDAQQSQTDAKTSVMEAQQNLIQKMQNIQASMRAKSQNAQQSLYDLEQRLAVANNKMAAFGTPGGSRTKTYVNTQTEAGKVRSTIDSFQGDCCPTADMRKDESKNIKEYKECTFSTKSDGKEDTNDIDMIFNLNKGTD